MGNLIRCQNGHLFSSRRYGTVCPYCMNYYRNSALRISGYGYAVIIDHGGGITTLYGHNEELLVSEGQSVSQGQVIAHCGSTGNSTGPHCHFEVRQDGETVSPYNYL